MRNHTYRPRGVTPELREVLDRFYATPAGKIMLKTSIHIESDKKAARSILENLLNSRTKNKPEISSIIEVVKDLDI